MGVTIRLPWWFPFNGELFSLCLENCILKEPNLWTHFLEKEGAVYKEIGTSNDITVSWNQKTQSILVSNKLSDMMIFSIYINEKPERSVTLFMNHLLGDGRSGLGLTTKLFLSSLSASLASTTVLSISAYCLCHLANLKKESLLLLPFIFATDFGNKAKLTIEKQLLAIKPESIDPILVSLGERQEKALSHLNQSHLGKILVQEFSQERYSSFNNPRYIHINKEVSDIRSFTSASLRFNGDQISSAKEKMGFSHPVILFYPYFYY